MYRVDIIHDRDFTFNIKSGDYTCTIDALGRNGLTPPDTLLASLASCIGVYIRKYSDTAKLNLANFTITAEAEFSQEAPICFKSINVIIDLKDVSLDERRKKSLFEFVKNCPVHNTLKCSPRVEIELKYGNQSQAEG
jgi:uncharacterized OsmC-like protein